MHEYQLSGSGNIGKTNFYISGNYYTQDGFVANSNFSRYNIMGNIGRNFTNKISATLNIRSSVQYNNNNLDQYYGNDVILMGINKSPCLNSTPDSLYYNHDASGHISNAVRTFMNYTSRAVFGDSTTTQKLTSNNNNKLNANVSAINLAMKFLILDNLYMNGSSSVTLRNNNFLSHDKYSYPSYSFPYPTEVYYKSSEHYILLNQQLNLNYFKNFNNHEIIFTLGYRNYADNANWNLDSLNSGNNNLFPRDDVYFMRNSLAINSNSGSITRLIQSYAAHLIIIITKNTIYHLFLTAKTLK